MRNTNSTIHNNFGKSALLKNFILILMLTVGFVFISPVKSFAQAGKAAVALGRAVLAKQAAKSAAKVAAKRAAARAAAKRAATANARKSANKRYDTRNIQRPPSQRYYTEETLVNFCNYTGEPELQVAVGHAISAAYRNEWISRGWYRVPNGKCRTVSLGRGYAGYVYTYAVNQDSTLEWRGRHQFYVNWYNGFSTRQDNSNLGRNRNYKSVGMREFKVVQGVNNYNYR